MDSSAEWRNEKAPFPSQGKALGAARLALRCAEGEGRGICEAVYGGWYHGRDGMGSCAVVRVGQASTTEGSGPGVLLDAGLKANPHTDLRKVPPPSV